MSARRTGPFKGVPCGRERTEVGGDASAVPGHDRRAQRRSEQPTRDHQHAGGKHPD